jgi:hypothetical protein
LSSDILLDCLERKRDDLGGQAINQFCMSFSRESSTLLDIYLRPHLLSEGQSYIYLAENNRGERGRPNFDPLNSIEAMQTLPGDDWALPGRWGLFNNPLGWVDVGLPNGSRPPSERAVNVGFCVYTLEFDGLPLSRQLQVICDGSLRKGVDTVFRRFKDYRGYEVIYGGRKSLHYHFVFDLRHWSHDLAFAGNSSYQGHWRADFPDIYLREAHRQRWNVIAKAFLRYTGIEVQPDPMLQYWEQNRRVPLGLRLV